MYEVGGVPGLGVPPGSSVDGGEEGELSFLDFMLTGTVSCNVFEGGIYVELCKEIISIIVR